MKWSRVRCRFKCFIQELSYIYPILLVYFEFVTLMFFFIFRGVNMQPRRCPDLVGNGRAISTLGSRGKTYIDPNIHHMDQEKNKASIVVRQTTYL